MKTCGVVEVQLHTFLTSALNGGEWSASCPSCCTHGKRVPRPHWIGGWVGPRASMDVVGKEKYPPFTALAGN